jgi:hypothetical protein
MTPQLRFNVQDNRWELWLAEAETPVGDKDASWLMQIQFAWNGETWNHYKFYRWMDGVRTEVVTRQEFDNRWNASMEYMGDANLVSDLLDVENEHHPVFKLREHWEAMLTLGLFVPSVNLS